jgi:hypothetical protein
MTRLSTWYDETPLRVLRWINGFRYGWLVITAMFLLLAGIIGLTYGWLVGTA